MQLNEYKTEAMKTAIYPNQGKNIYYPTLGLVGEAGELSNKVKKVMRDDNDKITEERKQELIKELGDVLWYVACLSTEIKVKLEDVAKDNLKKLSSRKERGKVPGSGDHR